MAKGRVLLAHGNSDCRKIYGSVLSYEGYDVEVADDADSAFRLLATLPCDVIVADLYLSSIEGDECFLRRVRVSPIAGHLPVVIITGWMTEPHRRLAMAEKADAFLPLPVRPRELVAIIADLLPPRTLPAFHAQRHAADQRDHSIANGF